MSIAATTSAFSLSGSNIISRDGVMKKHYSSCNAIVAAFPPTRPSYPRTLTFSSSNNKKARPSMVCHLSDSFFNDPYYCLSFIAPLFFKCNGNPAFTDVSTLRNALSDESMMGKLFEEWMRDFERVYPTQEEKHRRFVIFKESVKRVYEFNKLWFRSSTAGLNDFSDKELRECCGGYKLEDVDL